MWTIIAYGQSGLVVALMATNSDIMALEWMDKLTDRADVITVIATFRPVGFSITPFRVEPESVLCIEARGAYRELAKEELPMLLREQAE